MTTLLEAPVEEDYCVLFHSFVHELGTRALQLSAAQQSGDCDTLNRIAGELRQSAEGYGFAELAVLAETLQLQTELSASAETDVAVSLLVSTCEEIRREQLA